MQKTRKIIIRSFLPLMLIITSTTGYCQLTLNSSITGLENKIYSGDRTVVAVLPDIFQTANCQSTYSWQLTVVSILSGSISSSAIASPTSRETAINWPADFAGTVDVRITTTRCSSSKQSIKRVSILATPAAPVMTMSTPEPQVYCPGTTTRYRINTLSKTIFFTKAALSSSAGAIVTVYTTQNNVPIEWSVTWNSSSIIMGSYEISDGIRTWTGIFPKISNTVLPQLSGGKINPIPIDTYCSPYSINLTLASKPSTNNYVWQYCNSGNCSPASPDWTNNAITSSSFFPGLVKYTVFRIKLDEERCGLITSNIPSIIIEQTPRIAVSDQAVFSGNTFSIPVSDVPMAQVTVSSTGTGVAGSSNFQTIQGATTSGVLMTDTLRVTGDSDGTVNYSITARMGLCGSIKSVTVKVYKTPVIYADRNFVYKGLGATLSTDRYDSYEWRDSNDRLLGSQSIFHAFEPGSFKLKVTKNGLRGESGVLEIGDQFDNLQKNYIITRTPLQKFTSDMDLKDKLEGEVMESVQYFDGISRPLQTVNSRMSPSHFDLVQLISYDHFGREVTKYLPYISSQDNGRYQQNAVADQQAFYKAGNELMARDPAPFSQTILEMSPLNRILKQGSQGLDWQPDLPGTSSDHAIGFEYSLNTAADSVIRFSYTIASSSLEMSQYAPGILLRNKVIDEEKNDVIEFVDKLNRTVCKKVKASSNLYATTYYVYDDIGNLVVIIPPEGLRSLTRLP